jgi:hypothetical protein
MTQKIAFFASLATTISAFCIIVNKFCKSESDNVGFLVWIVFEIRASKNYVSKGNILLRRDFWTDHHYKYYYFVI